MSIRIHLPLLIGKKPLLVSPVMGCGKSRIPEPSSQEIELGRQRREERRQKEGRRQRKEERHLLREERRQERQERPETEGSRERQGRRESPERQERPAREERQERQERPERQESQERHGRRERHRQRRIDHAPEAPVQEPRQHRRMERPDDASEQSSIDLATLPGRSTHLISPRSGRSMRRRRERRPSSASNDVER